MTNSYEDDPVKEKARKEICIFADRHLPKDRTNATALYLASTSNRESSWLDKLGIPKQNRLILEGDPTKIGGVKQANPGIAVLPLTTHEFFASREAQTYAPFWYCGLDYECQLGDPVLKDIQILGDKGLLRDGGVLYTNVVGHREQIEKQKIYMENLIRYGDSEQDQIFQRVFGEGFDFYKETEKVLTSISEEDKERLLGRKLDPSKPILPEELARATSLLEREFLNLLPEPKLEKLREYAISRMIQNQLYETPLPVKFRDFCCPGTKRIFQNFGFSPANCAEDNYSELNFLQFPIRDLFEQLMKNMGTLKDMGGEMRRLNPSDPTSRAITLEEEIERNSKGYFSLGDLEIVPLIMENFSSKGYMAINVKPFFYRSNKNTPMMLDIMQVRRMDPSIKEALEFIAQNDWCISYSPDRPYLRLLTTQKIKAPSIDEGKQLLKKESDRLCRDLTKRVGFILENQYNVKNSMPERKYLGNSALPLLTLSAARKCILEGMNDEQIDERYHVPNWGRVAAVRANVTMGRIKKKEPRIVKKSEPEIEPQIGCKHLISRDSYRNLPKPLQMRLDYFIEEAIDVLRTDKQNRVRQAFSESKLGDLIDNSLEPIRFYAFFDDVQLALSKGEKITPEFLRETYSSIRDAERLTEIIEYKTKKPKQEKIKSKKKEPSEQIKAEIRELIISGIPRDEIWETYKNHFDSRLQFGAVTAWASPNLAKKRNLEAEVTIVN